MTPILIALAAFMSAPHDHPRTFLFSVESIRLRPDESIDRFEIDTWGVDFKAVCHIPEDWEISAGSLGPGGKLAGVAGHGASQLRAQDLKALRSLVLIRLVAPVQKNEIRTATGVVPATFGGFANVRSGSEDQARKGS